MLRRLYLYPFFKNWCLYTLGHLVFSIILMNKEVFSVHHMINFFFVILGIAAITSPFLLFYLEPFTKNINWMLNKYANRKRLVSFHFCFQSVKAFLLILPFFFYYIFSYSDLVKKLFDRIYNDMLIPLWSDQLFLILFLLLFFSSSLWVKTNTPKQQRVLWIFSKSTKKGYFIDCIILSSLAVATYYILRSGSSFVQIASLVFISAYQAIETFNNSFLLWKNSTKFKVSFVIYTMSLVLISQAYYSVRAEVLDSSFPVQKRIKSHLYLGSISPQLSKKELHKFSENINSDQFYQFLTMNINKIETKEAVKATIQKKEHKSFLSILNKKNISLSKEDFSLYIEGLISSDKRDSTINDVSHFTKKSGHYDADLTGKLLKSHFSSTLQIIGLFTIKFHVKKELWWPILEKYKKQLKETNVKSVFKKEVPKKYLDYIKRLKELAPS